MIAGKKIVLREFREEDLDKMHQWVNDRGVTKHLAFAVFPRTLNDCSYFLKKQLERENDSYVNFVIAEKSSPGIYIGSAGLKNIDYISRKAEFSIVIGFPEYWEKGYGAEATELVVRYGFESLNLNKIYLKCIKSNSAAAKMYEKAGFSATGEMREDIYIDGRYHDQVYMEIVRKRFQLKGARGKQ